MPVRPFLGRRGEGDYYSGLRPYYKPRFPIVLIFHYRPDKIGKNMLGLDNTTRTFTSLNGLAIKGNRAAKRRDEVFCSGTIKGDNMVLVFKSRSRRQISPRKMQTLEHLRFVTCQRKSSPSGMDFWWEGVRTHQTSLPV